MKPKVTHAERRERRREMAQAVTTDEPVVSIARRFGVSKTAVYEAAKEFGVARSQWGNPPSQRNLDIIAAYRKGGRTCAEIARDFGVSRAWVSQLLTKNGETNMAMKAHEIMRSRRATNLVAGGGER